MHDEKKIEEIIKSATREDGLLGIGKYGHGTLELLLKQYSEHLVGKKVEIFRERIWNLSKPNFDSVNGGEDTYTIRKQDLNLIVKNLTTKQHD